MVLLHELLQLSAAAYKLRRRSGNWKFAERIKGRYGFVATLWKSMDGPDQVLSIRGTKRWTDCLQDLRLLLGREPRAWREGRDAVSRIKQALGASGTLYLTGHSIGGAYASALGAESGTTTVTFNAPGMREALRESDVYGRWAHDSAHRQINVCVADDFIWRLSGPGLHTKQLLVCKSGNPTITRHGVRGILDAWHMRSPGSSFFGAALRNHGLRAFKENLTSGPWNESVDALMTELAPVCKRTHEDVRLPAELAETHFFPPAWNQV